MNDCIFCKIARNEIPCVKVYENEKILAFLDINPANLGHTLVIPKNHSLNINDIKEDELNEIMRVVKKISKALMKINDGVNVLNNNGKAAGQLVEHLHFHVIPRNHNDGYKIGHWEAKKHTEQEMKEIQNKIKTYLKE
ncbi:HIT family protein [Candidatus Woesearchaeota archaeon]|nr:HIT family protein [Candidatus Woesearchaeota archaeon]